VEGVTRFGFDESKAAAAAALPLKLDDGAIDCMRLLKLLYIAGRRVLECRAWAPTQRP
jgi:hypothetical protein